MQWFRRKEPGEAAFDSLLERSAQGNLELCISRINLGEVFYTSAKNYGEPAAYALVELLLSVPVEAITPTDNDIAAAALLKARFAISYADAFAAVLSTKRDAPLVTGDRDFRRLEKDGIVRLHWLGV